MATNERMVAPEVPATAKDETTAQATAQASAPSMDTIEATVKIKRFNPEEDKRSYWAEYKLAVRETDRVLDVLHEIKWEIDGSLTFRRSCAHGICGSDAMLINGVNRLACKILVRDLGAAIAVEPIRGLRVIKDLIVDMEPFFDSYKAILPYFINHDPAPAGERLQSPEDRAVYDASTKCILCAACTTSCPVFWTNGSYLGPAAIVNAHRFIYDSRDQGTSERMEVLNQSTGLWRCRTAYSCTEACPRDIPITEAIEQLKREMMWRRA
ncbi:succinate dehydrogenase iron-sulfur subunit [soil metagenome]